jgi:hypothetical protein
MYGAEKRMVGIGRLPVQIEIGGILEIVSIWDEKIMACIVQQRIIRSEISVQCEMEGVGR